MDADQWAQCTVGSGEGEPPFWKIQKHLYPTLTILKLHTHTDMISLFCILLCLSITSKLRPPTLASPTVHWSVGVLAGLLLVRNDQSRVGHQSEESAAWRRGEQGEIILLVQCSSRVKNCCIQNIVGRHGFQVPGLGGCKGVLKLYILRSDPTWLCYFQGFHKTVYMTHNNNDALIVAWLWSCQVNTIITSGIRR